MSRITRALTVAPVAAAVLLTAAPASARPVHLVVTDQAYALSTGKLLATDPAFVTNEAWQVTSVSGPFTATNTATAITRNCPDTATTACNAEAVAFQIILSSNVTPDVTALALTDQGTSEFLKCTGCTATSMAEQWVVSSTGTVTLTGAGAADLQAEHSNLDDILASPNPQTLAGALKYFISDVNGILANPADVVTTGVVSTEFQTSNYVASPGGSAPSEPFFP